MPQTCQSLHLPQPSRSPVQKIPPHAARCSALKSLKCKWCSNQHISPGAKLIDVCLYDSPSYIMDVSMSLLTLRFSLLASSPLSASARSIISSSNSCARMSSSYASCGSSSFAADQPQLRLYLTLYATQIAMHITSAQSRTCVNRTSSLIFGNPTASIHTSSWLPRPLVLED